MTASQACLWIQPTAFGEEAAPGRQDDLKRMTDVELMKALQAQDSQAMRILVERFSRRIFKYLYGWVKNREDALDLTQEVLMRVYEKADLYHGDAPLAPWIFRIAHNLFHDHLRRKNYKVHAGSMELNEQFDSPPSALPPQSDPERFARSREAAGRVHDAIRRLPQRQREVIQLRLLSEMKLDEIAQALDISLGGVKSTLHNALHRLRRELSDLEREAHV